MMRYAIVVEKGPASYGAYVPDLPGCVAAAETRGEVLKLIREAIDQSFVSGFRVVMAIGAVMAFASAGIALALIKTEH